jgi:hypothetical protein
MQPRLVFRTHYQVDEPAILRCLVQGCSSAVRSSYDETVAAKLSASLRRAGKDFNEAAGRYAVDLAHGLQLVNDQNAWAPHGHLLALVARSDNAATWAEALPLDERERLVFCRIFLEHDGAALLWLGRYVNEHGSIPNTDGDWNELAQRLLLETYEAYLRLTVPVGERVGLRGEIDRIRRKGYRGKSGAHKLFVHLQTMLRVGLLERAEAAGVRRYVSPKLAEHGPLLALLEHVSTVEALEQVGRSEAWMDVAATSLGISANANREPLNWPIMVMLYTQLMATGIAVCPLSTLIEAFQVEIAVGAGNLMPYSDVLDEIKLAQKHHLRDVRFHVDRRGKPAFIKLSDAFVAGHSRSSAPA